MGEIINMISINNLCFSYGKKTILADLSLQVKQGTCVGIVGANGCGKSTLLSILSGILIPSSGSYFIQNQDVIKHPKLINQSIGYVPQENPLIPELTVKDNLSLWYAGSPFSFSQDLKSGILPQLQINSFLHMPVYKLSGGMKKRVSIALALVNHPAMLILDEPSAALDLICKKEIHEYLSSYLKTGGTILFTTHEESELDLCNVLYVLRNGNLHTIPADTRGNNLLQTLSNAASDGTNIL